MWLVGFAIQLSTCTSWYPLSTLLLRSSSTIRFGRVRSQHWNQIKKFSTVIIIKYYITIRASESKFMWGMKFTTGLECWSWKRKKSTHSSMPLSVGWYVQNFHLCSKFRWTYRPSSQQSSMTRFTWTPPSTPYPTPRYIAPNAPLFHETWRRRMLIWPCKLKTSSISKKNKKNCGVNKRTKFCKIVTKNNTMY